MVYRVWQALIWIWFFSKVFHIFWAWRWSAPLILKCVASKAEHQLHWCTKCAAECASAALVCTALITVHCVHSVTWDAVRVSCTLAKSVRVVGMLSTWNRKTDTIQSPEPWSSRVSTCRVVMHHHASCRNLHGVLLTERLNFDTSSSTHPWPLYLYCVANTLKHCMVHAENHPSCRLQLCF